MHFVYFKRHRLVVYNHTGTNRQFAVSEYTIVKYIYINLS